MHALLVVVCMEKISMKYFGADSEKHVDVGLSRN